MTQVEVCNLALGWVGSELITSISDTSTPARLCRASWNSSRDVVLSGHEWAFAVRRFTLAADSVAPAFGYERRFPIPSSVLRVLRCVDGEGYAVEWQREGSYIVSDEATIYAVCLIRVETTADLPEYFGQALACLLASQFAIPLAQDSALQATFFKIYKMTVKDAANIDSMQGRSTQMNGPGLARFR